MTCTHLQRQADAEFLNHILFRLEVQVDLMKMMHVC